MVLLDPETITTRQGIGFYCHQIDSLNSKHEDNCWSSAPSSTSLEGAWNLIRFPTELTAGQVVMPVLASSNLHWFLENQMNEQ